jgi:hypothetical protein
VLSPEIEDRDGVEVDNYTFDSVELPVDISTPRI